MIKVPVHSASGKSSLPGLEIATCLLGAHMAFLSEYAWERKIKLEFSGVSLYKVLWF